MIKVIKNGQTGDKRREKCSYVDHFLSEIYSFTHFAVKAVKILNTHCKNFSPVSLVRVREYFHFTVFTAFTVKNRGGMGMKKSFLTPKGFFGGGNGSKVDSQKEKKK